MSSTVKKTKYPEKSFYIKFYPSVKSTLGCEKATLILGRLEYWFEKYATGFYKFVEPCSHPLYREGDSWSEEIGFSRKIFAKAFDLIGVRYKSKSAFLNAQDRFQGKLYASYHDRKTNQTYFIRNHDFASQLLKKLFTKKPPPPASNREREEKKNVIKLIDKTQNDNGRSWNGQKRRSFGGTIGGKEDRPILIQRNTPSLETGKENFSLTTSEHEQKQRTEEMIKIWVEEIGELGVSTISNNLSNRLYSSLESCFHRSLEDWRTYCRMIASSKFLMGEAENKFFKRAWITWAIKAEAIERIKGGDFKLGDRQTKIDIQIQDIYSQASVLEIKKREIERNVEFIENSVKLGRRKTINDKINSLSEEESDKYRAAYEEFLDKENNVITEQFKKFGWKGTGVTGYFHSFLFEKIENMFYESTLEEEVIEAIERSNLKEKLQETCNSIEELKQIRLSLEHKKSLGTSINDSSEEILQIAA